MVGSSPSTFAIEQLKAHSLNSGKSWLKPMKKKAVSSGDRVCGQCRRRIAKGEHYEANPQYSGLFTEGFSLHSTFKGLCCDCHAANTKKAMSALNRAIVTSGGVFKINKWDSISHWLRNPPEPPFVVLYSTSMNPQHIAWKASFTLDKDFWSIQVGGRSLPMRRPLALKAEQACIHIAASTGRKAFYPFRSNSIDLSEPGFMTPSVSYEKIRRDHPELEDDFKTLDSLKLGEVWAMNALIARPEPKPELEPVKL